MRRLLGLVLAGCAPSFDSIDAACPESLDGADRLGDTAPDLLLRVNCYRRYLGLGAVGVDGNVQRSVEGHVAYVLGNGRVPAAPIGVEPRALLLQQSPELEGFTGVDVVYRLEAVGAVAPRDDLVEAGVWGWPFRDATWTGDDLVAHPYARDLLFQPGLYALGHAVDAADGVTFGYLEAVATVPSGRRLQAPVVYPKDGQDEVPVSWHDPEAVAPDVLTRPADRPWGFPITVTVSTWDAIGRTHDPFALVIREAALTPEGGEPVDLLRIQPAFVQPMPVRTTVIVVPEAPLVPDTTYRFTATIGSTGQDYGIDTTFTTAATGDTDDSDAPPDTDDSDVPPDTDDSDVPPDTDETDPPPDTDPPAETDGPA